MTDSIAPLLAELEKNSVILIAVSKKQPIEKIKNLYNQGVKNFGENYLQEALGKINNLKDLNIIWHFIGPIQSNKTAEIAKNFDWIHSVDKFKIAQRLSNQRPVELAPLSVLIQVNIDREESKSGVMPEDLLDLVKQCEKLPNIYLKGLMCIPAPRELNNLDQQGEPFRKLRELLDFLKQQNCLIGDDLSMGMSADFRAAILEGASLVRLGTLLFGARG